MSYEGKIDLWINIYYKGEYDKMAEYTISEEGTLPSKGLVYQQNVNPNIKIRSMTTEEEMKRLGHSDLPYKILPEIIDDCLIDNLGIKTYDMCVSDYQYLLFKLRIATYGSKYKINTICPICGTRNEQEIDLDSLKITPYSEKLNKYLNITLPKSNDKIELRMQTPRSLDEIVRKTNELTSRSKDITGDPAFLFTLQSLIYKVNGVMYDPVKLDAYVRKLPAADSNYIMKAAKKINDGFGIDTNLKCRCSKCNLEFDYQLPITGEFFGPDID